jgi:enamine deaminase RidA (YjgF/YER057c/UK114 family)
VSDPLRSKSAQPERLLRHSSGGPYEARWGYSRVVRIGSLAVTAGCTAVRDGQVQHPGDPAAQTKVALGIALAALKGVGIGIEEVVSTRMYITDAAFAEQVGQSHGEIFAATPPAATMVVVAGLVDPAMLVEVEVVGWAGS